MKKPDSNYWEISKLALPPKSGDIFHRVSGPAPEYWPSENSVITHGMPRNVSMMTNGIRNAPVVV